MTGGVIDLAVGTPRAPEPAPATIDAACAALRGGANQYGAIAGDMDLRRAIAAGFRPPADPLSEITVTVGATEGMAVALLATVDPGDEVVLFEPFFENFVNAVALVGGVPRFVRTRQPDWRFDPAELRAAFTPRTRAIILNSPANPTGHVLDRAELDVVADLCARWNVVAVSDEAYRAYVFDDRPCPSVVDVPGLRERSVVVGSFSKSHAVSGWRTGYLWARPGLTRVLREMHAVVAGTSVTPLQAALGHAAADPGFWRPADDLSAQRAAAVRAFEAGGFRCLPTEGGCYLMVDISPVTTENCESYAHRLLAESGVLTVPGSYFYADDDDGRDLLRIAFNRPLAVFDDVFHRLTGRPTAVS
ncbi:methionine aminotransferase [Kibdelosporangium lantanae]